MAADFSTLPAPLASFDLTFDQTFQGIIPSSTAPDTDECHPEGAYLTWLAPSGWAYHYFEGYYDTGRNVTSRGSFTQGGLTRDSQKESAPQVIIRTAGLDSVAADRVATIYETIRAFLFAINQDGQFVRIPVSVPTGQYAIRSTSQATSDLTVTINLPARRSLRA